MSGTIIFGDEGAVVGKLKSRGGPREKALMHFSLIPGPLGRNFPLRSKRRQQLRRYQCWVKNVSLIQRVKHITKLRPAIRGEIICADLGIGKTKYFYNNRERWKPQERRRVAPATRITNVG